MSVVVGAVTATEHWPFNVGNVGVTGAVISVTITFCVAVVVLPFPSSNVHVTTVVPWVVIGNTVEVVPVTIPAQLSVVVGAVGVPEHSPKFTSANTGVTGDVISSTITFCVAVAMLPFPSSNVHVTTVVPWVVIGNTVEVVPVTVPAQLSEVVGAVGVPEHSPTFTSANTGVIGAVISSITTIWVVVDTLPLPSSNVQLIVNVPCVL